MKTLTMVDILSKVGKFIKNGKLGAQKHSFCQYDYGDGCRCVVGCGMNDEVFAVASKGEYNTMGIELLDISIPESELKDIQGLQLAHDGWAQANDPSSSEHVNASKKRAKFYKLLQQMRKKYGVAAG